MYNQLTPTELQALEEIESFEEGVAIALESLVRLARDRREIIQLCGPMSTGGKGNLAANMTFFGDTMKFAHERGLHVFNQIPYQGMMIRLTGYREGMPASEYNQQILEGFYQPVLQSGYISAAVFLPGWQSSHGASWEREVAKRLGLRIEEYPEEWIRELERGAAA